MGSRMKNNTTRNDGTGHIRLRQKFALFAAFGGCLTFALLALSALFDGFITQEFLLWAALAALFLAVASLAVLASAKCPQCDKAFIGNTVPESGGPAPTLFARECRYCGHPR